MKLSKKSNRKLKLYIRRSLLVLTTLVFVVGLYHSISFTINGVLNLFSSDTASKEQEITKVHEIKVPLEAQPMNVLALSNEFSNRVFMSTSVVSRGGAREQYNVITEELNVTEELKVTQGANITAEELEILERIVEAEAENQQTCGIEERENVAQLVLNRVRYNQEVNKNDFASDIKGVVFDKSNRSGLYQFCPLNDGRYWTVTVSERTKEAVQNVLNMTEPKHEGIFMQTIGNGGEQSKRTLVYTDNVHEYRK